jgi:hypothetical protein
MKPVFRKALERGKEIIRPYYLRWLYFPLFPNLRPEHFQDCWRYPSQTIARPGRSQPDPSKNDDRAPMRPRCSSSP